MLMEPQTVLVVEDIPERNNINSGALREAVYQVRSALTLGEALTHLEQAAQHPIVLDILLPDGNGLAFCRQIRGRTSAPILFLTSLSGDRTAMEGIAAGGDDYLAKLFSVELLLARIKAFWRRDEMLLRMKSAQSMTRGPLTLQVAAGQALLHGRDMLLPPREFALLLLLVRHEEEILTKERPCETVWNRPGMGDTRAVWVRISRLRDKLAPVGAEGIRLLVRRGVGYRFQYTSTK